MRIVTGIITMAALTHELRQIFKHNVDFLADKLAYSQNISVTLPFIKRISTQLELAIQERIQLLENDFHDYFLTGDYLKTVTEAFTDLDRLLRNSKTYLDLVPGQTTDGFLHKIKIHYQLTLVPLLNIMAKLENDYISIANLSILKRQELLNELVVEHQKLNSEEQSLIKNKLILKKEQRLQSIYQELNTVDLKREILQLNLAHDRLNLKFFKFNHPFELRSAKQTADLFKKELNTVLAKESVTHLPLKESIEKYRQAITLFKIQCKKYEMDLVHTHPV